MKRIFATLILAVLLTGLFAQANKVAMVKNDEGMKLVVDGKDFMINGMNWDYVPIGSTITDPGIWVRSDEIIKVALDSEMSLLKNMGVNAIRTYNLKPKWVQYIYENYGIYTMLNVTFGAYGLTINGAWVPQTDYADPATHKMLMEEAVNLASTYKDTPGLLLYMLGNENNYHLSWTSAETEDIPINDKSEGIKLAAHALYKAFNDATKKIKAIDKDHPVAICNGDLLYLDIVKEECKDIDIYGVNMYRGISFGNAFYKVKEELKLPILFAEFGADAFNAKENQEDQYAQSYYNVANWKEIYENAVGMGGAGNAIGGFTFQFSDGWWKYKQTENLDVHDNNASWSNGGYQNDFEEGENNMNEEWFGICAKGQTKPSGLYDLYPRAAYYALKEVHAFNPYASGATLASLQNHFSDIQLMDAVIRARGDKATLVGEKSKLVSLSGLRAEISTFSTGGHKITTPDNEVAGELNYPNKLGFDHMESYYIGVEARPSESVRANVSFNILGHVAENPIDEIFYENRGRAREVNTNDGNLELASRNRIQVYRAEFDWSHKWFDLKGFYRTGHYHWGYEGDFFGLYPEANYGPNIDIYNGEAPFGFEVEGKKSLKGFKVAFGPELWWGANPAVLLKYSNKLGNFTLTGIFHEDLDEQAPAVSSIAVPTPPTRRATLHIKRKIGNLGIEVGGIWSGQPRVGESFQIVEGSEGNYTVYKDEIESKDTWGGKIKFTYTKGTFNWYAQGAAMGLVANAGTDYTQTFTGWRLKDSGSGNQFNILTGFTVGIGSFQIAPNFLWQKPIVDPIPSGVSAPGRPRNVLDDPFAVRQNRETVGGELLLTYDPTPGTWMYAWNSDMVEDAPFAMSAGFVYRHHKTTQDAAIGILPDGRTTFAFPGAPKARDLWEVHSRMVSKVNPELGFIANLYFGDAEPNGSDQRLIHRFGADLRMIYKKIKLISMVKVNDWGPYDYHKDYNLTYPLQLVADLSTSVGKPGWYILPNTRIGIRGTWRSLDQYSPRYCPTMSLNDAGKMECNPKAYGYDNGSEWEIRTYIHFNIGK